MLSRAACSAAAKTNLPTDISPHHKLVHARVGENKLILIYSPGTVADNKSNSAKSTLLDCLYTVITVM